MNTLTDVDVRLLVESADRFLADRQEAIINGDYSNAQGLASLWNDCMQMGWQLTCVPVEVDGAGLGTAAAAALVETAGRHLLPIPLAQSIAAAALLVDVDSSIEEIRALAAWLEGGKPAGVVHGGLVSHAVGDKAWRLTWADNQLSVAWLGVTANGYGVDPLIPMSYINDEDTEVAHIACSQAVWHSYEARLRLLKLAEMIGAASAALALSVVYACEREQFGRPIGANQAVKHRLADNRMALDDARLVLLDACHAADASHESLGERLAMAELLVMEAANATVAQAVQTHGAMGITWECPVHFYFKRVKYLAASLRRERDSAVLLDQIWALGAV